MDLAADLPAPRDDEPADLRRDILDELTDHLHCAVDRERQRAALEGNEETATHEDHLWPRVVARFGHPARIARQLWWDAMKEKIMSQRTQTASLVVMGVFCLVMLTVTLVTLVDNRRLNEAVMTQLKELANRPEPQPIVPLSNDGPSEWNRLQIKCVWDSEDGEPAEGVKIQLTSDSENTAGIPSNEASSGADGLIDFGQVLYGTYRIRVTTPNGFAVSKPISVHPGRDSIATVVCPGGKGTAPVSLLTHFDWETLPNSLRDHTWLLCEVYAGHPAVQPDPSGPDPWSPTSDYEWPESMRLEPELGYDWSPTAIYLINETGQVLSGRELEDAEAVQGTEWTDDSQLSRVVIRSFRLPENPEFIESLELPLGAYFAFSRLVVADPEDPSGRRLLLVMSPSEYGRSSVSTWPYGTGDWVGDILAPYGLSETRYGMHQAAQFRGVEELPTLVGVVPGLEYPDPPPYSNERLRSGIGNAFVYWTDNRWELSPPPEDSILLADLAMRVPLGMEICQFQAFVPEGVDLDAVTDSSVDLFWKGRLIDEAGEVNLEEHKLLTGIDHLTPYTQSTSDRGTNITSFIVLTPEEKTALYGTRTHDHLCIKPSEAPVRNAATGIDPELLTRLERDSAQFFGTFMDRELIEQIELATERVVVPTRNPHYPHTSQGFSEDIYQAGWLCDVLVVPDDRALVRETLLLKDRLVASLRHTPESLNSDPFVDIEIDVTSEEAELISIAAELGELRAVSAYGQPEFEPFEQNANVAELSDELELLLPAGEDGP